MNKIIVIISVSLFFLCGCINTPRNYKSAGFQSKDEAKEYLQDNLYYANKLTDEEWDAFYFRFPEYWKDIQYAKSFGGTIEYHPWYTAYAFKWNTGRKKDTWSEETRVRLEKANIVEGDNIFKVIYARGVPERVIWDNDFEILVFKSGEALVFKNGVFFNEKECLGCWDKPDVMANNDDMSQEGMDENDVLRTLMMTRPEY